MQKKQQYLKKHLKKQKIRLFEVFGFFKTIKNKTLKTIFSISDTIAGCRIDACVHYSVLVAEQLSASGHNNLSCMNDNQ